MKSLIYLLADSQLFFTGRSYFDPVLEYLNKSEIRAAYIGSSNQDAPEYYTLFESAMDSLGIKNCCHVTSEFSEEKRRFLMSSDLILLSGGDALAGWKTICSLGIDQDLKNKATERCVMIGVSAGSVQLGQVVYKELSTISNNTEYCPSLGLVPYMVSVHEESDDWRLLRQLVQHHPNHEGIGIPLGGGVIYQGNRSVRGIAKPFVLMDEPSGRADRSNQVLE